MKADPHEKHFTGLAESYLIDPCPRVYWVVSVKKPWKGSWSSCTVHSHRDKALRDLERCRRHFRDWAPWGQAYLITAYLN